jgi:peptide/nickel transport system substrate-binding protein
MVKNPDYNWAPAWTNFKGAAKLDSILIRVIPEDATRVVELQSGNVQLLLDPPPPQEQQQFKNNPDYLFYTAPEMTIVFIGMNVNDKFFKDIRTRQAVGYAIDRQLINDTLYQGMGRPTTTYLVQQLGGDKGVSQFAPSYDPAKAKALLAEVGWVPGPDGILVADHVAGVDKGTRFEVPYWTYQEDQYKRLSEATQKMLADVGIKANVQLMDNPTYIAQLKAGGESLILRQYGWDNNDILEWFHHSKYLPYPNYTGVNDPKLDAMLDDANFKTPLWADRDAKYVEIHKYLIQNWYPWAPIRQPDLTFIARNTVKDFAPVPLRGAETDIWFMVDLATK